MVIVSGLEYTFRDDDDDNNNTKSFKNYVFLEIEIQSKSTCYEHYRIKLFTSKLKAFQFTVDRKRIGV